MSLTDIFNIVSATFILQLFNFNYCPFLKFLLNFFANFPHADCMYFRICRRCHAVLCIYQLIKWLYVVFIYMLLSKTCCPFQQWFTRLPPLLTFELSRFSYNTMQLQAEKLHNKFSFPQTLYLDRSVHSPISNINTLSCLL